LNTAIKDAGWNDHTPLSLIKNIFEVFSKAKWFSGFDLRDGYHAFKICSEDRHKTGTVTMDDSFYWIAPVQGLVTAPSAFVRM